MNELAPTSPQHSDAHTEIAAKIQAAADELPEHVVSTDEPLEGITRIAARPNGNGSGLGGNFVQHSQGGEEPGIAIGSAEVDQAAPGNGNLAGYGFRSVEGHGVEAASVRRLLMPHDAITRAGSDHYRREGTGLSTKGLVYDHEFGAAQKGQAGKLIASMVVKQAARTGPRPRTRL